MCTLNTFQKSEKINTSNADGRSFFCAYCILPAVMYYSNQLELDNSFAVIMSLLDCEIVFTLWPNDCHKVAKRKFKSQLLTDNKSDPDVFYLIFHSFSSCLLLLILFSCPSFREKSEVKQLTVTFQRNPTNIK